jgi:hypothetical protein
MIVRSGMRFDSGYRILPPLFFGVPESEDSFFGHKSVRGTIKTGAVDVDFEPYARAADSLVGPIAQRVLVDANYFRCALELVVDFTAGLLDRIHRDAQRHFPVIEEAPAFTNAGDIAPAIFQSRRFWPQLDLRGIATVPAIGIIGFHRRTMAEGMAKVTNKTTEDIAVNGLASPFTVPLASIGGRTTRRGAYE